MIVMNMYTAHSQMVFLDKSQFIVPRPCNFSCSSIKLQQRPLFRKWCYNKYVHLAVYKSSQVVNFHSDAKIEQFNTTTVTRRERYMPRHANHTNFIHVNMYLLFAHDRLRHVSLHVSFSSSQLKLFFPGRLVMI